MSFLLLQALTLLLSCCWRSWIEFGSSNESCSKGALTKDEFNKALDKQHSSRLRDSRELEAFWSAFCANSGIIGGDGLEFWGQSFVAGTSGQILAKASVDKEEILLVPVELGKVDVTRTHWPFLRDRRIDAYGDLTKRFID